MRRYDDPVEVRRGWVEGPGHRGPADRVEGPEQFLWHGRLWKVRAVLAHWVETGPWWQAPGVQAVIGTDDPEPAPAARPPGGDLLVERELWRVEAGRGCGGDGTFDLAYDEADGRWQLVGCLD